MYQPLPPSADPVPPSTNKYRPILTQYHHVSTSTAFYWPRTIMYQPVPPSTDPVPLYINQYHSLLTQYHQVSTSTAFYWPSTIIYQQVPLHADPVPPSINQYQPILLLRGDYRLLHSLPWVLSPIYLNSLKPKKHITFNSSQIFEAHPPNLYWLLSCCWLFSFCPQICIKSESYFPNISLWNNCFLGNWEQRSKFL